MNLSKWSITVCAAGLVFWTGCRGDAQFTRIDQDTITPAQVAKNEPQATPCEIWMDPGGPKKGLLVCVHGLGLQKGSYADFAQRMTTLGWGVYAVDVRGFGEFMKMEHGARRVDFDGCLKDVSDALKFVRKQHPGMPVFLVGESMGGGIALQAGSLNADLVDGIISACPASERHHNFASIVRVGANLLTGKKEMDVRPILLEHSTQKEELRKAWLNDPLARFEMAPVELIQFQHFMEKNQKLAKQITKTPIIILQGTKDDLVKQSGQESLIEDIPCEDKLLVFVDQSEHLILEEGQFNDGVISTVSNWLDSHLPKKQ